MPEQFLLHFHKSDIIYHAVTGMDSGLDGPFCNNILCNGIAPATVRIAQRLQKSLRDYRVI